MLYSHSRLSCFENCPLHFDYHYVKKIKVEPEFESIEAFTGSRVHEALEWLYKNAQMKKELPLEDLLAEFNNSWRREWREEIKTVKKGFEPKDYQNLGEKCLVDYYARYAPFDTEKTLGLEQRILVDLGDGYKLQGYIDRLAETTPGHYEIHDYKTGMRVPEPSDFEKNKQLAFYHIGVEQAWPDATSVELVWHYLAFDKEIRSKREPEHLDALKKQTIELIHDIERATATDKFPAKRGALCDWCEYKNLCPEWKHLLRVEGIADNRYKGEEGVKLVNKYAELSEKKAEIESELTLVKDAVIELSKKENYGRLKGSDAELIIRFYPRKTFPPKGTPDYLRFVELLKEQGVFDKYSVLDGFAFSKDLESGVVPKRAADKIEPFITRGETPWMKLVEKREDS
ncbi:MAG: PD-(D/E)XK nuclease family protein [Candidatus Micrarchaeia archaeon]